MLDTRPVSSEWGYNRSSKMDIKPSAAIKKCLFGEPDSNSLQTDLKQQFEEIQQADRLRWNYDFRSDEPLPGGRYQWQKRAIDFSSGAGCNNEETENTQSSDKDSSGGEEDSGTWSASSSPTKSSPWSGHHVPLASAAVSSPRTQRSISEFFRLKKRSSPSSSVSDETRPKRFCSSPLGLRDQGTAGRPSASRSLASRFSPISKPDS